jgi:hypothetical protein
VIPLQAKLGVGAVALLGAFWFGWEWRDRAADTEALAHANQIQQMQLEAQAAATTASEHAREIERLTAERLAAVEEAATLRNQEREVVEVEVTREVVRYAEAPDRARLVLPGDWVRVHDIAAAGRYANVPATAFATGRAYDAAGAVTDARALAVTTGNYATCNAVSDRLEALQAWVRTALAQPVD